LQTNIQEAQVKNRIGYFALTAFAMAGCCAQANAASGWPVAADECSANNYHVNDLASHAEWKEQRLAAASTTAIDPGANGAVRVHGWNEGDVLVKACVQTAAPNESEARALVSQISIAEGPGRIEPRGPSTDHERQWSVSYEIWVPNASNLQMQANNGSIRVEAVHGQIRFHTTNGSVHLTDVAGDVDGSTTNGSLNIDLAGNSWNGTGLRAETTNGSVHLNIPENYSAQVEASTVNGRVRVDFPVTVNGDLGKNLSFQVGNGGPMIQAKTVNGSIHIGRKA
jgi:Putative adhesin